MLETSLGEGIAAVGGPRSSLVDSFPCLAEVAQLVEHGSEKPGVSVPHQLKMRSAFSQ